MIETIDLNKIIAIAKEAGSAIMQIYAKDFDVEFKEDESPLTEADKAANAIICAQLEKLYPEIPILSEENKAEDYSVRKEWEYLWVVDPLDGTKEFIKKNGEFTVNIALVHKDTPVLGVVYAPALETTYYAKKGTGAFKEEKSRTEKLPLHTNNAPEKQLTVVASRSHLSPETEAFIDTLRDTTETVTTTSIGSSLKLCLVAEGKADYYPRLAPTMEWDTAAAQAVVLESGKSVYHFEENKKISEMSHLLYNKKELLNPWFIVH